MPIKEYTPIKTIDLSEEGGNVFALIGLTTRLSKLLELDGKQISKQMMSADYGNAVYVFNGNFGSFFDIVLPEGMTIESLEASYKRANITEEKMSKAYLR